MKTFKIAFISKSNCVSHRYSSRNIMGYTGKPPSLNINAHSPTPEEEGQAMPGCRPFQLSLHIDQPGATGTVFEGRSSCNIVHLLGTCQALHRCQ